MGVENSSLPRVAKLPQKKAVMMNTVIKIIDVVVSVVAIAMFMLRLTR